MSKKILAMLLVIVMVISMVPMTALAATCADGCIDGWVPTVPGSHKQGCPNCGTITGFFNITCYDDNKDGFCDGCRAAKGHTHAYTILSSNQDGTHKKSCACGEGFNFNCEYVNGVCACGYAEKAACQHNGEVKYTDNKNGTHQVTCKCGVVISAAVEHTFDGGRCNCGARKAGCKHDGEVSYKNNNDGTHKVTCECGKVIAEAAECEFDGGRCVCGARKAGCKHDGYDYVPRTDSAFVEWLYALIFG